MALAQQITRFDDDIILTQEAQYDFHGNEKYREAFETLRKRGVIKSEYDEPIWGCSNEIHHYNIDFTFDAIAYKKHFGRELDISPAMMMDILKCYIIATFDEFVISHQRRAISILKKMITDFGDNDFSVDNQRISDIDGFLHFINLPEDKIYHIKLNILVDPPKSSGLRELANFVNYAAVDDKITTMYADEGLSDEEFVRWFPIYFWSKITFILPLRATEMLLTPFDCIKRSGNDTYLTVRRTCLKKGKTSVKHKVNDDYKKFTYKIPYSETVKNIEKYQKLTLEDKRKYLFVYRKNYTINDLYSLETFNDLLDDFVDTKLIGDHSYDFAKQAAGITEFSHVNAGDSRHIAMANLYYQDAGAEICRQLADHENLVTSEGYYQNVANTIQAASIMKFQKLINRGRATVSIYEKSRPAPYMDAEGMYGCTSACRPHETGNVSDCIKENHLETCFGCRYFVPTETELAEAVKQRTEELDAASLQIIKGFTDKNADFESIYLNAHTKAVRCAEAFDEKIKQEAVKWQRHKPIVKNC